MGQYLKEAYEERDLAKALAKAHGIIDEETKKLSDKLHDLKLSHNRKKNALRCIMKYIERENPGFRNFLFTEDFVHIYSICENALFSDGRAEIK